MIEEMPDFTLEEDWLFDVDISELMLPPPVPEFVKPMEPRDERHGHGHRGGHGGKGGKHGKHGHGHHHHH